MVVTAAVSTAQPLNPACKTVIVTLLEVSGKLHLPEFPARSKVVTVGLALLVT